MSPGPSALLATMSLFALCCSAGAAPFARGDWQLEIDPATGALIHLSHPADPRAMNWIREPGQWERTKWRPDTSPEARSSGGHWGLVESAQSGPFLHPVTRQLTDSAWESVYHSPVLTLTIRRELADDGLRESYTFHNTSIVPLDLPEGSVSISTPLFDQYPDARRSLESRCHAHLWTGGSTTWINALRMNGQGPHLGLVLTQGSIDAYSQRGGNYSDRGTFLLHPAAMRIPAGQSRTVSWRLFWHIGWDDFFSRVAAEPRSVLLTAERYVVQAGEPLHLSARSAAPLDDASLTANGADIPFRIENGALRATLPTTSPGEIRFALKRGDTLTRLVANVVASPDALAEARVRFIVARQQRHAPGHPLDGAYLAYDNETDSQIYSKDNDHNAGRERMAMGVLGAMVLPRISDPAFRTQLTASLEAYARFVARELEDDSGKVYNNIGHDPYDRLYNFPWAAHLHLALHRALGSADHLDRMVRVIRSFYAHGGARFYPIGLQITATLSALADAGRTAERDELLALFRSHADALLKTGLDYPGSEVNYEQSIVAPAVQILLEVHRATGEPAYLEGARRQLDVLVAFAGLQPDHRLHEVSIRHWDDYWFGKLRLYGDTFPHYWSTINALAYAHYARASGDPAWHERARSVAWGNLSLFSPDGHATAAHVYAFSTNGHPGRRDDPWANDQDWALIYLFLARELGASAVPAPAYPHPVHSP